MIRTIGTLTPILTVHSAGNLPAAAVSRKAPSMKKSASQPTQPGPSKATVPHADTHFFPRPISSFVRTPPHIQQFQDDFTIFAAKEPDGYIASYCRTLSGITGIISDESQLPSGPRVLTHTIGDHAIRYLTAHGYTAESQHAIARAYNDFQASEGFVGFLCGKGMARSEASWLWDYISDTV